MDTENIPEDEFLDVEPYEGPPAYDCPLAINANGAQDDELSVPIVGFMTTAAATRSTRETLDWYIDNQTKSQIGFDPDGMCLKICRTARNIPAKYLSAKEAQDATPEAFRVYSIRDMRRGMIAYFDDPNDSNRFGHIATMIGRKRGEDPFSLDSLLFETNSVKADELVVVRGSYFVENWGDSFKFGATWLNGVEFDVPGQETKLERFNNGGPVYDLNLLNKAAKAGRERPGQILTRIETQIKRLPDHPDLTRVREFKEEWRDTRLIDMQLLDDAVKARPRPGGLINKVRDEIKRLINNLPDE